MILKLLLTSFGSGLERELGVCAAGASNQKEEPFNPKSSKISFDIFWVKFRVNR
jgi:hypothetical protein